MKYTVKAKFKEWLDVVERERKGELTLPLLVRLLEGAFNAGWAEGQLHAKERS